MAAESDANVIIHGGSGTSKELVASAIYHGSLRRDKGFVRVNSASLTETLPESELFGHEMNYMSRPFAKGSAPNVSQVSVKHFTRSRCVS